MFIHTLMVGLLLLCFTSLVHITVALARIKRGQQLERCTETVKTVRYVASCPKSPETWNYRSEQKNCASVKQNCGDTDTFVYHCLVNQWRNGTLEFCALQTNIIGSVCAEFNIAGGLIIGNHRIFCKNFKNPCPPIYRSDEVYKYPECLVVPITNTDVNSIKNISAQEYLTTTAPAFNGTFAFGSGHKKEDFNFLYPSLSFGFLIVHVVCIIIVRRNFTSRVLTDRGYIASMDPHGECSLCEPSLTFIAPQEGKYSKDKDENISFIEESILSIFQTEYHQRNIKRLYIGVDIASQESVLGVVVDSDIQDIPTNFMGFRVVSKNWHDISLESLLVMNRPDASDSSALEEVEMCIATCNETLFSKHSNIEIISACSLKSKNNGEIVMQTPCIVIYCTQKGIRPKDEEEFPKMINDIPVDVMEGFFYSCPLDDNSYCFKSSNEFHDKLRMGCSIGRKDRMECGTLGGFVDLRGGHVGFITCAHVLQNIPITETSANFDVVQPGYGTQKTNNVCGVHVRSACPKEPNDGKPTVDAALVKICQERKPERGLFAGLTVQDVESKGFCTDSPPEYDSGEIREEIRKEDRFKMCVKCGVTTRLTRGLLHLTKTSVRYGNFNLSLNGGQKYMAHSQYEIKSEGGQSFASFGDSGSFVFQVEPGREGEEDRLVCIGMLIGCTSYFFGIVTPIRDVLDALGLHEIRTLTKFQMEKMTE